MTTYYINVRQYVHRCPAEPNRHHVIQRQQTIVATTPGGPCLKPISVQGQEFPCGRIAVYENQCAACKTQVVVNHVDTIDLGFQGAAELVAAAYQDTLFEAHQ
ncbi:hypothetical protein Rhe02_83710 [Rhizocola hellebori]|uniref:Uncharacterized protein n=1 Tax=Rhizocola hellebori TaxID=1392758 RepID=A0A8J3QG02_9ACTN|nr:hypothetical protein [Rhizocola hellebori]GIH10304.1 hypothetical protein Rhe02_83710 [Rhizocola hellebori]